MRLFVGIRLDEPTRAVCIDAQHRLLRAAIAARYTDPDNLHLTLAFLGNVEEARLEEIVRAIDAVADEYQPFALALDKIGAFPNERRPRIIFLGSRDAGAHFRGLTYALRDEYRDLGFTFDDDAVAHITLARIKEPSRRPLPLLDVAPHALPVTEITLFESLNRNNELRYESRYRKPLAPPVSP